MFLSQELILKLSFPAARGRLMRLVHDEWLGTASSQAYTDGYLAAIRVGPVDLNRSALLRSGY